MPHRPLLDPLEVRARRATEAAQGVIDRSGLKDLPCIAKTAATVLVIEEAAIWGAALAPEALGFALTHPQETLDFVTSMFPGTTPAMSSLGGPAGWATGEFLGIK